MQILICLISGIFWAMFDLTRKLTLKHIDPKTLLMIFSLVQIFFFFLWSIKGNIFIYLYSYFLPGLILITLGIFSALLFLKSIKESELSLTIPLLSFSPFFSSIFSSIFLKEELSLVQYTGIFGIILGTLILYSKGLELKKLLKSFKTISNNKSAKFMILVSVCWSLTPVLDKICLQHSSINIHGLIQSFFTFVILYFLSSNKQKQKNIFKNYRIIFITTIIGTVATITQFYAILLNFVPIMESIKRATGQFSAIILGKLFFNEKVTKQKIIGIILISIGVNLII